MKKEINKKDMSHWDIYNNNSNVLGEKKQLEHIINMADGLYKHGHHSMAGFSYNEAIIEGLLDYASSKGIKLVAKNYNKTKYGY